MRPAALKLGQSCARGSANAAHKDFFGIGDITSKDIAGCFSSGTKLKAQKFDHKYKPLLGPMSAMKNKPVEINVTFGTMRFDKDNAPQTHGQFDKDNAVLEHKPEEIKQLFIKNESIDAPEDSTSIDSSQRMDAEENIEKKEYPDKEIPEYQQPFKIVEVEPTQSLTDILRLFKTVDVKDIAKYENKPPLTFFFNLSVPQKIKEQRSEGSIDVSNETQLSGHKLDVSELEMNIMAATIESDSKPTIVYEPEKDQIPIQDLDPMSEEFHRRNDASQFEFDKTLDEKYDVREPDTPLGALEYLKNLRSRKVEPTSQSLKEQMQKANPHPSRTTITLDSKGFKIYSNQVPDWSACRHIDVLSQVKQSIIYHNYDILAVNKPYGIASHDEERRREPLDMNSLLRELAAELRLEKVYLAHRLDKTTTGVLLFATSLERARHLNKLFKADQIKKAYWCITKGIPDPMSGIIDIPIGEFKVAGKTRSCLAPERIEKKNQLSQRYRESRRAVTEYRVIQNTHHSALVEVSPKTGVKHQIRCHLGFGLLRPILGDHKYSHLTKLAPQTLPAPMLKALHLRQQKVRTLPIHLHAKSIVIPGAKANGETLFIKAPVPDFFVNNLKTLGLLSESIKAQAKQ